MKNGKERGSLVEPLWLSLLKAGYKQEAYLAKAKILAEKLKKREEPHVG